ncbi:MAG: DUF434 domain-containing protein [Ruminococcus sp.]|nr:DUF434 domain-containing protein [Ruminococcus sp.]
MSKQVKRGFVPTDERDFHPRNLEKLRNASEEVYFLMNRGYPVKSVTTFVGNHYLLSERQRLALARTVSSEEHIRLRKQKELSDADLEGRTLYIDGFNTIITLEIAFSNSMLFECMDGTIRDLAGLRGTYRLVDKTDSAILAMQKALTELKVEKAVFYLDAPVSNSGRLKERMAELMQDAPFELEIFIENAVDYLLKQKNLVVTADAIILDECESWYNLTKKIIQSQIGSYAYLRLHKNAP